MEQQQDNPLKQPQEQVEYVEPEGDKEKRNEISQKFYTLSSAIKNSSEKLLELIQNKETIMYKQYCSLTEDQEEEFLHELDNLNYNLGLSRSILDSYITFTRSQPDFDKFFNLFYQVHLFITKHRETIFYRVNARKHKYYYPYTKLENALHKTNFLFSRLRGTLNIAGDYLHDAPNISRPSSHMPPGYEGSVDPYRYGGMGYGGYEDWRRPFMERDIEPRLKKRVRDIGDVDDKI